MKHIMIFVIYSCVFFLLLFLSFFGLQYYVTTIQASTKNETDTYLKEISALCVRIIENQVKLDMDFLEVNANFFAGYDPPQKNTVINLFSMLDGRTDFKRFGLIFPDGTTYTSDNFKLDLFHRDFFRRALGGESNISDVLIDSIDGARIVVFAVPVKHGEKVVAVLYGTKDIDSYSQQISINPLAGAGKCFIIKTTGEFIAISPESHLYESTIFSQNILEKLTEFHVSDGEYDKFVSDITNRLGGLITYSWENNTIRLAYAPMYRQNWMLLIAFEDAVVGQYSNEVIARTSAIVLLCVVVLLFVFLSLSMREYLNQKEIRRIAFTDKVTGMANWEKFKIIASRLLEDTRSNYAVLSFETDNFKLYNEIYGQEIADNFLRFIAEFLKKLCAQGEAFCRNSADNFILLLKYNTEEEFEARINELFDSLKKLDEGSSTSFRFGVYRIPDRKQTISECCDKAYIAKLIAKQSFESHIAFYDKTIHDQIIEEKKYEEIMEHSLINGEFIMYLQPKVNISTLKVSGAEALVRWQHTEKGLIPPAKFIPLFEKNGFITRIDFEICRQACCKIRNWLDSGIPAIPISVNFSRLHLQKKDFIDQVNAVVDSYGIPRRYIEIEITETIAENFQNADYLKSVIIEFQRSGYEVSMDDFGSGYSSLNMLAKLPVNNLKMDKRFFDDLPYSENGSVLSIISGIIEIAKDLNMKVVAEGIETRQQYEMLKNMNCDMIQGFYFAPPMQVEDFERYLEVCNRGEYKPADKNASIG